MVKSMILGYYGSKISISLCFKMERYMVVVKSDST
jgi:hypothetical protein